MDRIRQGRHLPNILYTSYRFFTIQCKLRFLHSGCGEEEDENNQGMELNHSGGRRRRIIRNALQGLGFKN